MMKTQNLIKNAKKYVSCSLTEEFVLNYSAVPKELYGWRYFRIEMGGHAQSCFKEVPVWLPPRADAYIFDLLFDFWQAKGKARRKILHEIIQELERSIAYLDKNTSNGENLQVKSTALESRPPDEAQAV